jgi:DNA polymerase III epsilon subunit-like protein
MPKILTFDIETTPILGYSWGFYEQTLVKVVRNSYLLTVGYKWMHEKQAHVLSLPQYKTFKKDVQDDTELAKDVWKLLDEADIVITQNGDRFDVPKLNTRFIKLGLPVPSPFKSVDTKKISSGSFYFANNKLDNLGEELGLGKKMQHEGFTLWEKCMAGDEAAFKKMAAYNKRDVVLTEQVYLKFRPWAKNHPNLNAFTERDDCPKCGSNDIQYRGEEARKTGKVKRFVCKECGAFSYGKQRTTTTIK